MPDNSKERADLTQQLEELKKELAQVPSSDTAKRSEIEKKIADAQQRLREIDGPDPEDPNRPDGQFFNKRELVEMTLVGGGGALGGIIGYCFSEARIWENFVPSGASFAHCVVAGAFAAGLTVWFVARTDRNRRVPCFLFSILCGLAGLQMIEKAAKTLLPDVDFHKTVNIAVGATKVSADLATSANAGLQISSTPDKVEDAQNKIEKVGESIKGLNQALTTAKDRGDTDATQALNKSITDAAQSLAKIKLDSQSIPAVSEKAEEILKKNPEVAKNAEQKELDELKAKYLNVPQQQGWYFLGRYVNNRWDRQTTDYKGKPVTHKETATLTITNTVYLRNNLPTGPDYKLGDVVNALFEKDKVTVDEFQSIQRPDGERVWAHATQITRAAGQSPLQPGAAASPAASIAADQTTSENSPAGKHRARRRSR